MSQSADKPLFTTLRFVPTNGNPASGTRRIAAQACESCRKRKKRCIHTPDAPLPSPGITSGHEPHSSASAVAVGAQSLDGNDGPSSGPRPRKRPRTSDATLSTSHSGTTSHSRFIGDLNPDVELLSASNPHEPLRNNVGAWHADDSQSSTAADDQDMFSSSSLLHSASQPAKTLLVPLMKEICFNQRPSRAHRQAMEVYYFNNIHPILPAVDIDLYHKSQLQSPTRVLQEQIICLLASLNRDMAEHLLLSEHNELFAPAEFAKKIVGSMRLTIELSLVSDKTIIIRALVAMSLMTYGPESIDLASQYFVRAVHLSYTIGIHLPQDMVRDQRVAGLFCYIWSIDRLHAAIQGRPIFMHEIDMGKNPRDCVRGQTPGFQALVYIATLLDKTIALYRPGAMGTEISDAEYPTFEEIAAECNALGLPGNMLSALEMFYHAVGILSCRHRSGSSSQGFLARNARRVSSAMQINAIMEEDTARTLVLLPFVPYAVSLALSAAYRDFKHSRAVHHRDRALRRLAQSHRHLLSLGRIFWSAAFVSELAAKILHETGDTVQRDEPEPAQEHSIQQVGEHSTALPDALQPMDVTLGHGWNISDMDDFLEGTLDPSMPWDIEGFLGIPGLDSAMA